MTPQSSEPPLGGSRAHIKSIFPSLVPSEQRVAQLCIDSPETVARMSVADLVAETGTSPATIVRACKGLGFAGFQHLRQVLLRDLGAAARDSAEQDSLAARGEPGSSEHLVSGIFSRAAQDIRGALGSLDFTAFDGAAAAIRRARRLLIVANGASLSPAKSLALRFLAAGVVCEAPGDIATQHISAAAAAPRRCVHRRQRQRHELFHAWFGPACGGQRSHGHRRNELREIGAGRSLHPYAHGRRRVPRLE
ncbi:hypothetical protein NHF49_018270 [Arthrobacter sp. H16F315]|nr:hypothetical protein [Arthrobacter sp. H16F315]MDD1478494.1 hypothetical protein [Arthrobacter sp. H16F315]